MERDLKETVKKVLDIYRFSLGFPEEIQEGLDTLCAQHGRGEVLRVLQEIVPEYDRDVEAKGRSAHASGGAAQDFDYAKALRSYLSRSIEYIEGKDE